MKFASILLLVCCLAVSFFPEKPARARDDAGNTRERLFDRVPGSKDQIEDRDRLLTFKSSDEFPDRILDAIKAQFKQKKFVLSKLEKQDTIQMGGKGRIYNYLCKFEGYEKQYHFLFATLYKDTSKGELVYKTFFCGEKAEFDGLVEKGEKVLKDTLAYYTPRFFFYKGYEDTSE
ncbi:MAG: hypothetical protein GY697_01400 [Desulfobacterales bacterium]|nr:hypothetical protein [Desulfobacterales bacterium]